MVTKSPYIPHDTRVWVFGDPIDDVFVYGDLKRGRFIYDYIAERRGGMLNVLHNARKLAGDEEVGQQDGYIPVFGPRGKRHTILARHIELTEEKELFVTEQNSNTVLSDGYEQLCAGHIGGDVLVLSDYNKGNLTTGAIPREIVKSLNPKVIVFDSRYRTLDPVWAEVDAIRIWRCTGKEYNHMWQQKMNVDYVIHSDGANDVRVTRPSNTWNFALTCQAPEQEVVDTIGAGDTMTAAVAVYIAKHIDEIDEHGWQLCHKAAQFGVAACQSVINKKHTAQTDLTLVEYEKQINSTNTASAV